MPACSLIATAGLLPGARRRTAWPETLKSPGISTLALPGALQQPHYDAGCSVIARLDHFMAQVDLLMWEFIYRQSHV